MTNYDRIKNMSVDEMAENLLGGQAFCPYWMYSLIGKCAKTDCQKCIKQWLESEVETE